MDTKTDNGDLAYKSTGVGTLDLFTLANRNARDDQISSLLARSLQFSKLETFQILANLRDVRGGKGERRLVYLILTLLRFMIPSEEYKTLVKDVILPLGSWKDLNRLHWLETQLFKSQEFQQWATLRGHFKSDLIPELFAEQLRKDFTQGGTLCSKWFPSENSHYGKLYVQTRLRLKLSNREMRKALTKSRAEIHLVETMMSQHETQNIKFEHVPAKAMLGYRSSFLRDHNAEGVESAERKALEERFRQFLQSRSDKLKVAGIAPHELVARASPEDDVVEAMWTRLVNETTTLDDILAVCDISGSMAGQPVQVAMALSLLIANCNRGPFGGRVITFSGLPRIVQIRKEWPLWRQVDHLQSADPDCSTNLFGVFEQLLGLAKLVGAQALPKRLVILTDMQFNQVSGHEQGFQKAVKMFEDAGFRMPQVVFWNLQAQQALPVQSDQNGVAYLSGFSEQLFKVLAEDKPIDPVSMMREVLKKYTIPESLTKLDIYPLGQNFPMDLVSKAVGKLVFKPRGGRALPL